MFRAPKAGSSEAEYEDAAWPDRGLSRAVQQFRCAVADGATETSYSRTWADVLVGAYAYGQFSGPTAEELAGVRSHWQRRVDARLRKPHPWYADEKARSGAFAAMAALEIGDDAETPCWSAYAIGDCCVVQIRDNDVVHAFPMERSEDFNDRPRLLGSVTSAAVTEVDFRRLAGAWEDGDAFYLMSDAIAAWFYRQREAGERPWQQLGAFGTRDRSGFRTWLETLREGKLIKNDDVTVLRLRPSRDQA